MKLNLIGKIYVCHYTKLTERVDPLKEQLSKYNLDTDWILSNDKEDINIELLKNEFVNIDNFFQLPGHYRKLRLSELSLLLKHYEIWKDMKNNDIKHALILEDDALLSDNFVSLFNEYTKDINKDYDIIWVGSCCNLHTNGSSNLIKKNGSRCTHGYMLNLKIVDTLIENIKYNNYPVDFYFNYIIDKFNVNNYWMEPDLISQNPKFETSIQNG
jgi:GR25 family glycosyltransferase involved in LPS biosynthesis